MSIVNKEHVLRDSQGRDLRLVLRFIFDKYDERKYAADIKEFFEYQTKRSFKGEHGEQDLRMWHIKGITPERLLSDIPYSRFQQMIVPLIEKCMLYIIRQQTDIIQSDKLIVHLKIARVKDRNFYMQFWYDDDVSKKVFLPDLKASDPENACFDLSGFWLLQSIVAPMVYAQRVDFTLVSRYFSHELTHFRDLSCGMFEHESKEVKRIKEIAKKRFCYVLRHLHAALYGLRDEGYADFRSRAVQEINKEGWTGFRMRLDVLATLPSYKECNDYFDENFSGTNASEYGCVANGRMMCAIIAMAISQRMRKPFLLKARNESSRSVDFLDKHKKATVLLDSNVMNEAIREIGATYQYDFLTLYEESCSLLGIKERILTHEHYDGLCKKALSIAEKARDQRLSRRDFPVSNERFFEMKGV